MTAPPKAEWLPGDRKDTRHPPPPARAESGSGRTVFATVADRLAARARGGKDEELPNLRRL
ncbi:hypothetical protein [Streptomyces sp. 3213.3]|uniref:hypothetical protein n=1 Tax=Streptomyces sp. 3213.3 TaxID=1855348 RepID=UPI001041BE79|nr:hypothetical protein [Streptomyces sp. 3213.3]